MKPLQKFVIQNFILLITFILAGYLAFGYIIPEFYNPMFLLAIFLVFIFNTVVFGRARRKKAAPERTLQLLMPLFALKFGFYLVLAIIFILTLKNDQQKIAFVASLFAAYLAFTWLGVSALVKHMKSEQNSK